MSLAVPFLRQFVVLRFTTTFVPSIFFLLARSELLTPFTIYSYSTTFSQAIFLVARTFSLSLQIFEVLTIWFYF